MNNFVFKKERLGDKRKVTILGFIRLQYKRKGIDKGDGKKNFLNIAMPDNHLLYEYMRHNKYEANQCKQ